MYCWCYWAGYRSMCQGTYLWCHLDVVMLQWTWNYNVLHAVHVVTVTVTSSWLWCYDRTTNSGRSDSLQTSWQLATELSTVYWTWNYCLFARAWRVCPSCQQVRSAKLYMQWHAFFFLRSNATRVVGHWCHQLLLNSAVDKLKTVWNKICHSRCNENRKRRSKVAFQNAKNFKLLLQLHVGSRFDFVHQAIQLRSSPAADSMRGCQLLGKHCCLSPQEVPSPWDSPIHFARQHCGQLQLQNFTLQQNCHSAIIRHTQFTPALQVSETSAGQDDHSTRRTY